MTATVTVTGTGNASVNGPIGIGIETANRNQVEMSIHVIRIIGAADIQETTGREAIYTEAGVLQRQTRTRRKEEELQVSENVSISGVVVGTGVLLDIVNVMSAPLAEQVLAIMTERGGRGKKRGRDNIVCVALIEAQSCTMRIA